MRALLADLRAREELRLIGCERIAVSPQDSFGWVGDRRVPMFVSGQVVMTIDAETGRERRYTVVAFNMDTGALDVRPKP